MRLSARGRYALRLMIDLADRCAASPVTLKEIAARQGISKRYLEQVAAALRDANLIIASQGHGGGYRLQRRPEEIRVMEILTAAIGPLEIVRCIGAPHLCPTADDCPSRRMWARVNQQLRDALGNVSLSELRELRAADDGARPPSTAAQSPCTSAFPAGRLSRLLDDPGLEGSCD